MGLVDIHWPVFLLAAIHDLSVAVYVGGAVAMEFVLGPAQKMIPPAQAQVMGQKSADRFLILVWVSLVLILVTGLLRMYYSGIFSGGPIFSYSYGRTLLGLLFIWLLLAINGALITFALRPRLTGKLGAGSTSGQADQDRNTKIQAVTWIEYLSRADLVLAVIAVLLGASLLRGGIL
ncbi:MAG: CopD family protein [Pseudomonadales bacterium]